MSLWKIAWRSIQQRAFSSSLTAFSMALGVTLVVAVLVGYSVIDQAFKRGAGLGYDILVGAKGGKLQLVLNSVYHLSTPVENIPYSYYKEFTEGKYKNFVSRAIPCCMGDNYLGFRVVGTIPEYFAASDYGLKYRMAQGRNFEPQGFFEGVIGSLVARETRLKVGDHFRPTHGVSDDGQGHKHDAFTVVGILADTGTPNDRAIFINMEGFYLLDNHAKPVENNSTRAANEPSLHADTVDTDPEHSELEHEEGHEADHEHGEHEQGIHAEHEHALKPLPEDQREVTAIFIKCSQPIAAAMLPNRINEESVAQAVLPIREITSLFDRIVSPIQLVLLSLTILVVVVSGVGILVSIYNSMNDRRRDIAIMRALGASRTTVLTVILFESILLALAGGLLGWFMGHALIGILSPHIASRTGVSIGFFHFVPVELALIPGLIVLASLVGYLPALSAYRTDVSKSLTAGP